MSGGSYNYLCYADPFKLSEHESDLASMADALTALGHADAAGETEDIIAEVAAFERRVGARLTRLSDVWRAVEWIESGDSGPEALVEALERYRPAKTLSTPESKERSDDASPITAIKEER